jgi:ribosome-associated protein
MDVYALSLEVTFTAVASRGPGGQNVNKVASAAQLSWNVQNSRLLTEEQKTIVLMKLQNRINRDGELVLRSDEFRDLPRNKARALEKLRSLLLSALHRPKPRKATRPTRSSKFKRLEKKSRRGQIKASRRRVTDRD